MTGGRSTPPSYQRQEGRAMENLESERSQGVANDHPPAPHGDLSDGEYGQGAVQASGAPESGLSSEEINRLDEILSRAPHTAYSSMEGLDGFLAATALSPQRYLTGRFLDRVCDEMEKDGKECFLSLTEEIEFKILIMRYVHHLLLVLADDSQKYVPILQEHGHRGKDWAVGFEFQIGTDGLYWDILAAEDELCDGYILQILELAWGVELPNGKNKGEFDVELSADRRERNIQNIGVAFERFQMFAEAAHAKHDQAMREVTKAAYSKVDEAKQKTGRNAPCPCGSGKKFKRCCGK